MEKLCNYSRDTQSSYNRIGQSNIFGKIVFFHFIYEKVNNHVSLCIRVQLTLRVLLKSFQSTRSPSLGVQTQLN